MKRSLTNKLFFKAYPYKIELRCEGSNYIKLYGIDSIIEKCQSKTGFIPHARSYRYSNQIDNNKLYRFAVKVKPYLDQGLKSRAENKKFRFFVKDKETADSIVNDLFDFVTEIWEPGSEQELEYLTSNTRKVIVDDLPYSKYTHRIYFKSNWPKDKRFNFLSWLRKYPPGDYSIPKSTYRYLEDDKHYCFEPFMYISQPKMLTMLTLFAGDYIKYTEEFVPRHTLLL